MPCCTDHHACMQVYEILALVDQREQFDRNVAGPGKSRNESLAMHLSHIQSHHNTEARTLPVGDIAWIARCTTALPGGPAKGICIRPTPAHLIPRN